MIATREYVNIEYQLKLKNNPIEYGHTKNFPNIGISLEEITLLEQAYNNGNPFPKALKELLYLAGKFCYVLDTGTTESPDELQQDHLELLSDNNFTIDRPFYVIDCYNYGDQFLFVYLDEGANPKLNEFYLPELSGVDHITNFTVTLSDFIDGRIQRVLDGTSPF